MSSDDDETDLLAGIKRKDPPAPVARPKKKPDPTKIRRRIEFAIKTEAAKELMRNCAQHGGRVRNGDAEKIVETYRKLGYDFVTLSKLKYHTNLLEKDKLPKISQSAKSAITKYSAKPAATNAAASTTNGPTKLSAQPTASPAAKAPITRDNDEDESSSSDEESIAAEKIAQKTPEDDDDKNETAASTGTSTDLLATITKVMQNTADTPQPVVRNRGGRPKGSYTKGKERKTRPRGQKSEHAMDPKVFDATTKVAYLYIEARDVARANEEVVPKGTLDRIIAEVEQEFGLPQHSVKRSTVIKRVSRGNPTALTLQRISPLVDVEPKIVEYCVKLVKMGQPLFRDQMTTLTRHLIKGTPAEERLKKFKKRRFENEEEEEEEEPEEKLVGVRWFDGFMRRHRDKIASQTNENFDRYVSRYFMLRMEHFKTMYEVVYEAMCSAGIAEQLSKPVLFDIEGSKVSNADREWAYGLPSRYKLTKPDYMLYVDVLGAKRKDSSELFSDGQMFMLQVDCTPGGTGETTKMFFSVYNFTSGTGEPVMCAVIFKSDKTIDEIPISVKWGIDIFIPLQEGRTEVELFQRNSGRGQAMQGGPQCTFMGRNVPCFVGTSTTGNINSELLHDICIYIDHMDLYERSSDVKPFMLLDGFRGRLDIPFIDYIHDEEHPWTVCVGLPHGSHLLQVADASEFNGLFVEELAKAKSRLLSRRVHGRKQFYPSDIMPLINNAWSTSFARSEVAKKAIAQRGWNPMNYALLLHPQLHKKAQSTDHVPI